MKFPDEPGSGPNRAAELVEEANATAFEMFLGRKPVHADRLLMGFKILTDLSEDIQCYKLYYATALVGWVWYGNVSSVLNAKHEDNNTLDVFATDKMAHAHFNLHFKVRLRFSFECN